MSEMHQIEQLAYNLARERQVLSARISDLEEIMEKAKRARLRGIKQALGRVAEARQRLQQAVESSPQLFQRPRSVIFHGIRVGLQKGRGRIDFADDQQVIGLIKKRLPDKAELLIKVSERLVRKALEQLTAAELKRIGCRVIEADDQVLIKPVDSAVDKLVNALMKDLEQLDAQDQESAA